MHTSPAQTPASTPAQPPAPLHGAVTTLVPITLADTEALLELWQSDPGVLERWPRWSAADIAHLVHHVADSGGWWICIGDERVGFIQHYQELDMEYRHAGMDIFLVAAARGRGAGTDAIRTLSRWLIDELGHHRLVIDPSADNAAAIRVYEKVGFKPIGVLREYQLDARGAWEDCLYMDLLARELT